MRILCFLIWLSFLSACSVQSSQLNAIMDFFNPPSADITLNSWSVKYAGYETIVYPVNLSQGTLFSNQDGDQVLFDGWSVRRVSGLGVQGPAYQISDTASARTFLRGSRSLALHNCSEWNQIQKSGKKKFSQSCKGVKVYSNNIIVDTDGSISVIQQVVDERYNQLILTKLN